MPVERNRSPVLIFYAGPFRGAVSPPPGFETEYEKLPTPELDKLADLARLLILVGQGLLRFLDNGRQEELRAPASRKQMIRHFLEEHAHEPVSLTDLAATLHVSPSRAGHLVRESFAVSFQNLVLAERMIRARNLLLSTDCPQKEIARCCGFGSVCYFSRMFRRFYGMAPGRFRREKGRNALPPPPEKTFSATT